MKINYVLLLVIYFAFFSLSFGEILPNFMFNNSLNLDSDYNDVKFTPDKNEIVIGGGTGVNFYSVKSKFLTEYIKTPGVLMLKWSDDGSLLFIITLGDQVDDNNNCYVYDYQLKIVVKKFVLSMNRVFDQWGFTPRVRPHDNMFDISPDNHYIAYISDRDEYTVYDLTNDNVLNKKKITNQYIYMIQFSSKDLIYIGSMDHLKLDYQIDIYNSYIYIINLFSGNIQKIINIFEIPYYGNPNFKKLFIDIHKYLVFHEDISRNGQFLVTRRYSVKVGPTGANYVQLYDIYDLTNQNIIYNMLSSFDINDRLFGLSRYHFYGLSRYCLVLDYFCADQMDIIYNLTKINLYDGSLIKSDSFWSEYNPPWLDKESLQSFPDGINEDGQVLLLDERIFRSPDLVLMTYDWENMQIHWQTILPTDRTYKDIQFTKGGNYFSLYLNQIGYYDIDLSNQDPAQPTLDDSLQFNERKTQFGLPVLVSGDDKYWFQPQELKLL